MKKLIMVLIIFISCQSKKTEKESRLIKDANYFLSINDFEKSINTYSKLITIDSLNIDFFYRRAYSYFQLSKYHEAKKDYIHCINNNYNKPESFFNLSLINLTLRKDSLAKNDIDSALKIIPNDNKFLNQRKRVLMPKNERIIHDINSL